MSTPTDAGQHEPHVDLYTRNGFAGPAATIIRAQYTPPYTRVEGSYAPYRFCMDEMSGSSFTGSEALPVAILEGEGVSIEFGIREAASAAAIRNVFADELHYVLEGEARLETDFGFLDLRAGDFVLLPRAVTYRWASVTATLRELILVTASELTVDPENAPGTLNVVRDVDVPTPDATSDRGPAEHVVVVRHGHGCTKYFYDYDPMPSLATAGAPIVRRFNIEDLHGLGIEGGDVMPARIINDATTRTLVFNLGSRRSNRPPVHHNADYDEVIFYVAGPGHYGAVDKPGTVTWTPKGIIHQGPEEDVPEGYKAWLVETRAALTLTPVGRELGRLMETGQFDLHPSESTNT